MTDINHIEALFKKYEDEFLEFDRITPERKLTNRADLHAFLLLDKLFPSNRNSDIVCSAEHDQIWLDVDIDDIAKLTEAQIIELCRCGVFLDEETLSMFM